MTCLAKSVNIFIMLLVFSGLSLPGFSTYVFPDTLSIDTTDYIPSDINYNLLIAAHKGYSSEVLRLLNNGADINTFTFEGVTPLMYAAENGDILTTRILVLNGADINRKPDNGITALISAIRNNNVDIVELLIRNGANVNDPDTEGVTPLMYAVAHNYLLLSDMLIYYNADIHQKDTYGNNPLILAVLLNDLQIVEIILDQGGRVNSMDNDGFTPLMLAAQNGDTAIISILIKKQADLNAKNKYGNTPLRIAVKNGNIEAVKLIMKSEAYQNSVYQGKNNLLDLAKEYNHKEIIEILKKYGVRGNIAPNIDIFSAGTGFNMNLNDLMIGLNTGIQDKKYKLRFNIGYYIRPLAKRVLIQDKEDTFYQFWERRSLISTGLEKLVSIKQYENIGLLALSFGVDGNITFGRNYRGSTQGPVSKFKISPTLGFMLRRRNFQISAKYLHLNLGIYKISPHRIGIELQYLFDMRNKRYKDKQIDWL
jgi:ankyrin repeat protein